MKSKFGIIQTSFIKINKLQHNIKMGLYVHISPPCPDQVAEMIILNYY